MHINNVLNVHQNNRKKKGYQETMKRSMVYVHRMMEAH